MSFDEQHMAYTFPCTQIALDQRQEEEAQATDLRAELIALASQRYQNQQEEAVTMAVTTEGPILTHPNSRHRYRTPMDQGR